MNLHRWHDRPMAVLLAATALAACAKSPPQMLGTLEFDRIGLPAPAAERIIAVEVREGEAVAAGQILLRLDPTRAQAQLAALQAQAQRAREVLAEFEAGPRTQDIALARANLAAARAEARQAQAYYARLAPLQDRNYVAAADLDRARAAADKATGRARAAQATLDERLAGTRDEQLAQARAALAAAEAEVAAQRALLDKLTLVAPRTARVDSLPYRLGDQAPVGAPLALLLAGEAPYARIYVPASLRASLRVGDALLVQVEGRDQPLAGRLRMIRSEPVFTPYYALTGDDVARLSYLAEVALGADAASLPAGLPVQAMRGGSTR